MPAVPPLPSAKPPEAGMGKMQMLVPILLIVLIVLAVAILLVLLFRH
jgi:hypothetical protein